MIKGDSVEYTKLTEWVKTLPIYTEAPEQILTCEIGIREGLGSKIIMDEIIGRSVITMSSLQTHRDRSLWKPSLSTLR